MDDGNYLVREGNRRQHASRGYSERIFLFEGVDFSKVRVNIIEKGVKSPDQSFVCRLQTVRPIGAPTIMQQWFMNFTISKHGVGRHIGRIAIINHTSQEAVEVISYVSKYSNATEIRNKSCLFQRSSKKGDEWLKTPKTKRFHSWIDPSNGQAKIRSAATKGGLRDFAK